MRKRKKPVDLSHIYCIGDQDEAQRRHDELPYELRLHMCMMFAHHAGLCPDPGFYSGPAPKEYPED
jgi:hypothetical protein